VLFNLLQKTEPLHLRIEDVQPLNRYSIEARYPGDWEPIDESEARKAFGMVKKIRDVMKKKLADVMPKRNRNNGKTGNSQPPSPFQ
jgi:hypothetical protein